MFLNIAEEFCPDSTGYYQQMSEVLDVTQLCAVNISTPFEELNPIQYGFRDSFKVDQYVTVTLCHNVAKLDTLETVF